jgi:tetratricopeptide (TPR) repeat protein
MLAKSHVERGLAVGVNLSAAVIARAKQVLGHVLIDLGRPRAAFAAYQEALTLHEDLGGPNSATIAEVYETIARAYTELDEVDQAFAYLEKATAIHNAHGPSKMSRTIAIRALTCLRAGVADALAALHGCWRLQGMT